MMVSDMFLLIISIFLLICSALVSASEVAFFSLTPKDKDSIFESKSVTDNKILALCEDNERLLATILIANNLVNVSIITLLDAFIMNVIDFGQNKVIEFIFTTISLTFLLLLFGEIIPKVYSVGHRLSFCRFIAPIFYALEKLLWPLSSLLITSKVFTKHIVKQQDCNLSVDELEHALELTDKKGLEEEQQMLEGIIRFGEERACDIMTSRVKMVALDIKTAYKDVLRNIIENNYSRIPIYAGSQDNIKGILYIKDLLAYLSKGSSFRWQSLIRPPYFVPETKKVDDLLRDFQTNKVHIAIVVDEFGGTSGIVTMEDIIEEIVGEINDEYDDDKERIFTKLNQNTWSFKADTTLEEFVKIMMLDDEYFSSVNNDVDTIAGLILAIKGDFPNNQEQLTFKNFVFEVTEMNDRRILKIKVIKR